jgi:RNA polymerase sigma-70 factor (ECF subfamily)
VVLDLLSAARAGDEQAFVRLTGEHRRALHLHCYRMLGSLHDADDALQETMLRAWRGLGGFEPRAPFRAWLYRIATNVCLRMLEQRKRRDVESFLEPYPDTLLDESPDAVLEQKESIGLAFVAAMQVLPPKQRAVLVLRDVLDWSAQEVADLLEDSVAAVNSALQRARERLTRERDAGTWARAHAPAGAEVEASLMRRFQDAWAAVDVEGIVALLADDALLTMPPESMRIPGAAAIGGFFGTVPLDGALERIELVPTSLNGQPAFAAYADGTAYGVMVFAIEGEQITGITGFPERGGVFAALGLPTDRAVPESSR